MMRIAIADDLSADAGKLREFICRWAREQGIVLVPAPAVFESGEALLAGFAPDTFDVIFLDISVKESKLSQKREIDTKTRLTL